MLGILFAIIGRLCGARSPTGAGWRLAPRPIRAVGAAAHHCASTLLRGMAMHRLAQRAAQNPLEFEGGGGTVSCRFPAEAGGAVRGAWKTALGQQLFLRSDAPEPAAVFHLSQELARRLTRCFYPFDIFGNLVLLG